MYLSFGCEQGCQADRLKRENNARSAQVAELTKQAVSLANQTGRATSRAEAAEAQVAELKKDAERITAKWKACQRFMTQTLNLLRPVTETIIYERVNQYGEEYNHELSAIDAAKEGK